MSTFMIVTSEILVCFLVQAALATFNPASYPRYQQLDPSMLIYWKMQSDSIQMAIRVRSS
jgi:hypothetical protein